MIQKENTFPYIIAVGHDEKNISRYYIDVEKHLFDVSKWSFHLYFNYWFSWISLSLCEMTEHLLCLLFETISKTGVHWHLMNLNGQWLSLAISCAHRTLELLVVFGNFIPNFLSFRLNLIKYDWKPVIHILDSLFVIALTTIKLLPSTPEYIHK